MLKVLQATNVSKGSDLMYQGWSADRPWSRMRGLIGHPPLTPGQGLWISPCNGIHTLFMSFPIDVVYLNGALKVVALESGMAPWKVGRFVRGARSVLELPTGAIAATLTEVGDQIDLHAPANPA